VAHRPSIDHHVGLRTKVKRQIIVLRVDRDCGTSVGVQFVFPFVTRSSLF